MHDGDPRGSVPTSALGAFAEPGADAEAAVADVQGALATLVAGALDGASVAVVMGDSQGAWHVVSASNDTAGELTVSQLVDGEGPCIEVLRTGDLLFVAELDGSGRRPAFARAAAERAVSSMLVAPFSVGHVTRGALFVFGSTASALQRGRRHVQALAELAALALSQNTAAVATQRRVHELEHALAARITIEQAKGVLVERAQIDLPAAFGCLVRHAHDWGVALEDLARDVVAGRVEVEVGDEPRRSTGARYGPRPPRAALGGRGAARMPSLTRRVP